MKSLSSALCLGLYFVSAAALADDAGKKQGILPKVDKPIPDTYEPLDGADWNHRTSEELRTLREYQRQEKEKQGESEERKRLRSKLESKIREPGSENALPASTPEIEADSDSMRISDPE